MIFQVKWFNDDIVSEMFLVISDDISSDVIALNYNVLYDAKC